MVWFGYLVSVMGRKIIGENGGSGIFPLPPFTYIASIILIALSISE